MDITERKHAAEEFRASEHLAPGPLSLFLKYIVMNANCRCRAVFLAIALGLAACTTTPVRGPSSLANAVAKADAALNHRPISLANYNATVREICIELANSDPKESAAKLKDLGVFLVLPKIPLPLRRIEISVPPRTGPRETAGIPVVLEYETKDAPFFPPEGLLSMLAFFTSALQVERKLRFEPNRATSFSVAISFNVRAIRLPPAIS